MQTGVPVRVFNAVTTDDLGIAHVPVPIEIGDQLALEGDPLPYVVVELVKTSADAAVAAIVGVERAT